MTTITLNPSQRQSPLRLPSAHSPPPALPAALHKRTHPTNSNPSATTNASLLFIGTATTILEWAGLRILTDPNFLHAGDHVHLGPGVTGTRLTDPSIDLEELPHIDLVLLSHYHEDHFDRVVEEKLRRDLPIVTTPHAAECLVEKKGEGERFTNVSRVDHWESLVVDVSREAGGEGNGGKEDAAAVRPMIRVTGMPGKHVPPGPLAVANDLLGAVPPTNGWMLELGYSKPPDTTSAADTTGTTQVGHRIYITGDTLNVSELKEIPQAYSHATGQPIDLMLIHLGGTTIPSPSLPLLMVTMDAKQGVEVMKLVSPDVTIPIHFDDYDVFLSPLKDFKDEVEKAGWTDKVVYLDRGDTYEFEVRET